MLRTSYTDRISNERVLAMVNERRSLLRMVKERKMKYFGHLVRANGMQRMLLEGRIEGVKRRGAQRRTWMKDIILWTGMKYEQLVRAAEDRRAWRLRVANLLGRRHAH